MAGPEHNPRGENGNVTTAQLAALGIGRGSLEKHARAGRLHRAHVGVYVVGHVAPDPFTDWHGAVLACGPGAVLSHRSAATLWKIRKGQLPRVDVLIPSRSGRRRPGIWIHHGEIGALERRGLHDIPVASPARIAVDLAHELPPEEVHRLLREMQFRRLFDRVELELANARQPSRLLSRLLEDLAPTDSPLEDWFLLRVVRRHGLTEPVCQARVEGFCVDFLWPDARLIVEIDGSAHANPAMRQADSIRDNALSLSGYRVLRYTAADIRRRPAHVARQIADALRLAHPLDARIA